MQINTATPNQESGLHQDSTTITTPGQVSRLHQNAVIIANVTELVCSCVKKIAETDVASALSDDSMNRGVLASIVANHIQEKFINA